MMYGSRGRRQVMYLRRCCLLWRSQRRAGKELPKVKNRAGAKDIIEERASLPLSHKASFATKELSIPIT